MSQWIFVPTGNFLLDLVGDFLFECIYTQTCWAFDEMIEQGIDFSYYFAGVLDAECILEILLC